MRPHLSLPDPFGFHVLIHLSTDSSLYRCVISLFFQSLRAHPPNVLCSFYTGDERVPRNARGPRSGRQS
jgi:hypothetical protein